jgi:ABC-type sugar transport system substrate-binding protein
MEEMMKSTMKSTLIVLILAVLCVSFVSAGGQKEASGKKHIVFVTPLIGHPAWLEAKKGSEAAAEDFGFKLSWVGPATIDMDAEVQQIETAIAQKAAGILNCPLNPEAFLGVYEKAKEAGIPIINVQVDTPEDTRLAFIGTGMVEYGIQAAEVLAEKTNKKANIAVLQTSMDSGNQNAEFDSFKKVIDEKYPGMKVIVRETDNSDMVIAVDKINAIISTYPEVDTFFFLEGSAAPAAAQVLKEKGLTDKYIVLGIDDMPETLGAIREGAIWGTLTQNYYVMGYEGCKMILDHLDGKDVPSITDSGTTLVTIENIDTYNK